MQAAFEKSIPPGESEITVAGPDAVISNALATSQEKITVGSTEIPPKDNTPLPLSSGPVKVRNDSGRDSVLRIIYDYSIEKPLTQEDVLTKPVKAESVQDPPAKKSKEKPVKAESEQ